MNYWLLKSEPSTFGIENLEQEGQSLWDGVRNYQARNFLKQMQPSDLAFFYHSNIDIPGIVGLARIVQSNVIDPTQFNPESKYFDPRASKEAPRWHTVVVKFETKFPQTLSLERLKKLFSPEELMLVRKGNRLSVLPLSLSVAQRLVNLCSNDA